MAQLIRTGWFRPMHVKTLPAQEIRALLGGDSMIRVQRDAEEVFSPRAVPGR